MTDKHEADRKRIDTQNNATDFVRGVEDGPRGGFFNGLLRTAVDATPFGQAVAARTDFADHDLPLNKMIDMVEETDPEDLESSGRALWDARDAIKAAADELDGHITKVHWVGESAEAFHTWGGDLVTNAHHLSEFAGAAGDQIAAAAVGLAAVRGAMPTRDTVANRKRPEAFTAAEKSADKEEYATAVKVEKDRQEAINQMNRLGSYYAVSEEVLASLPAKDKTPKFTSMPDVGVPRPQPWDGYEASRPVSAARSNGGTGSASAAGHHATATGDLARHVTSDVPGAPTQDVPHKVSQPDVPVGTHIDSTGTLPPPTTTPVTGHTPPVTGASPAGGSQPSVFDGGYRPPMPNGTSGRGLSGAGGFRNPPLAQGRAGASGLSKPGVARATGQGPMNQAERAASTGQSQMGRGVTGGTPRAGGTAAPRANVGPTTGASRSNGVVGGRPTTPGGASAKGGPRIPRGTVIGGEEGSSSRSATGRLGQRGVFGAPESSAKAGSGATTSRGAGAGTPEAVTGRPAARNSVAGAERNGMTRGGAGLVRGAGRHGKLGREEEAQGSVRPDYLVENEETHLPDNPRRDVPPVVN